LNSLEKKSFYSFLALYIGSSFLFVVLSGYWYYRAQENSLENTTYYKLQHDADIISGLIINAQMHNIKLELPKLQTGFEYLLIKNDEAKYFEKQYCDKDECKMFTVPPPSEHHFDKNGAMMLVSSSPQEHLGIKYVLIKTKEYHQKLVQLKTNILLVMLFVFVMIVIISVLLARLFMKPIHQKVKQIENFIQDISHELNTPITALQMSASRAIQKKVYDEKILTNISISTKQLYSIYKSLAYLSFVNENKVIEELNLKDVINEVVKFYAELCHAKHVTINTKLEDTFFIIDEDKAKLLFSNLLSNAIKYSMPNKTITITLTANTCTMEDEGVGIAKEKLHEIFKLYERGSNIAGGFGVGLSIVKQICDEVGISIDVKSELNKGSIFKLIWD